MILCSTYHDPEGRLMNDLETAATVVGHYYDGWVVKVTKTTSKDVVDRLKQLGVVVVDNEKEEKIVENGVENDHLNALHFGVIEAHQKGNGVVQYTDGDRIIMAAKHFPNEFEQMAQLAKRAENTSNQQRYLNLRRDPEDYFSHHPPLVQTELEFNRLYSKVFGMSIDIGSTAHVMTLGVAYEIFRRSPELETVTFPHPLWLIIAREMGAHIESAETHWVLSFETPEQFRKEVTEAVAGDSSAYDLEKDYPSLQQAYNATLGTVGPASITSPNEWQRRFTLEGQYIEVLKTHLHTCIVDPKREAELGAEIDQSLTHLIDLRETIVTALARPEDEVRQDMNAVIARIDGRLKQWHSQSPASKER